MEDYLSIPLGGARGASLQFLFNSSADETAMISAARLITSVVSFASLTAMIGAKGMFLDVGGRTRYKLIGAICV